MRRVRGSSGEFNAMELAKFSNLTIEKFVSSVTHDVFWRAVIFEPLRHQTLCYCGTLFVVDKARRLEPAEGVTEVENVWRSIFISAILLQINSQNVVVTD